MEDLWKKFKKETKDDLSKINEFLESVNEKSHTENLNETSHIEDQASKNMVLDKNNLISDEKIKNENSKKTSRKEVYGKLKDTVKELMEKQGLSRAQAYRRAKKRTTES